MDGNVSFTLYIAGLLPGLTIGVYFFLLLLYIPIIMVTKIGVTKNVNGDQSCQYPEWPGSVLQPIFQLLLFRLFRLLEFILLLDTYHLSILDSFTITA